MVARAPHAAAAFTLAALAVARPALSADAEWTSLRVTARGEGKDVVAASGRIDDAALLPKTAAITFRCGTFVQTIPAERLLRTRQAITFRAKKRETGIQSFSLSLRTGKFTLTASRVEVGAADGFVPFSVDIGGRGLATQHELSSRGIWKSGEPMRATLDVQVLAVTHEAGNVQVAPAAKLRFPGGPGTDAVSVIGAGGVTSGPDGRVTASIAFTDASALDNLDLAAIFGTPPGVAGSVFSRITAGDDGELLGARFVETRIGQAATLDPALAATLEAPGGDGAPSGTLSVPAGAVAAPLDGVSFTPLSLGATLPAPLPESYVYAAGAEIAAATPAEFVAGHLPSMSISRPAWADRAAVVAADLRLLRFADGTWTEVPGRAAYDEVADRIAPLTTDPALIPATGAYAYAGKVAAPSAPSAKAGKKKPKPAPKRAIRGQVVTKSGLPLGHQVVLTRSSAVVSGADGTYEVAPAALGDLSVEVVQAAGGGTSSAAITSGGEAISAGVVVRSPRDGPTAPIFHELTGRTTEAGGLSVSPGAAISFTSTSGVRGMLLDDGGTQANTNDDRLLVPDLSDLGVSSFTWTVSLPGDEAPFVSSVTGPSIAPLQAILEAQGAGRNVAGGVASISVAYDVPAFGEVTLRAGFRIVVGAGAEIADLQLPAAIDGSSRVDTVSGDDGVYTASFYCLTGLPVVARAKKADGSSDDTAQIRIELPSVGGAQVIDFAFEELPVVIPPGLPYFDSPRARFPVPIQDHMAVALDGRVHVFGGGTAAGPTDLHFVYDPLADTWSQRASMGRPRQYLTGVELDGFIYAMGGTVGETTVTATRALERYDPATNEWTDLAQAPDAALGCTSAVVDGKIYLLGGQLGGFDRVAVYDPATDRWTNTLRSPKEIMGQGNAILHDGNLYVHTSRGNAQMPVLNIATGTWSLGVADSPQYFIQSATTVVSSQLWYFGVGVFDAVDRVWGPGVPVSPFRRDAAAAAVNGVVYGCGGSLSGTLFDDTNAVRPPWRPRAPMPEARENPEAAALGSVVYVAGGALDGASKANLWTYDTARDNWRIRLPMNSPRERFGLAAMDGKIYAVGGSLRETGTALDTAEVYDPVTGAWTSIAPLSKPRAGLVLGAIGGKLYACGGGDATVESYDPATNAWTPLTSMPETRTDAQAVVFGNDLLVFSGNDGAADRTTILAYRTTTDTWTVRADEPAVSSPGAAPVLLDGRIYVTGTAATGCARFEPVVGVRETTGADPYLLIARQRHAAVNVQGTIYIFGGASGSAADAPARRSVESHKPE